MKETNKKTDRVFEPKLPKKKMSKKKKTLVISITAGVLSLALVLGLCLLLIPSDPALSYHGVTLDREMYAFWFSMLKRDFMLRYGLTSANDTAEAWAKVCPREDAGGKTWGELLNEEITEGIKQKLVAAVTYDELGLAMTAGQRRRVDEYYSDMLEYVADGEKSVLKEQLAVFQTSAAALKKCAVLDLKAELLYYHLALNKGAGMGENESDLYLKTAELNSYYLDNYTRVKIVYLNNDSTGNGPTNDDRALLDRYYNKEEGFTMTEAKFDEFVSRSDEALHGSDAYPSGIYATISSELEEDGFLEDAVATAVRSARPGDLLKVETDAGVRYVYGYALDSAAYLREESAVFFSDFFEGAARRALTERSAAKAAEVEVIPEGVEGITVETVPVNTKFRLCTMG